MNPKPIIIILVALLAVLSIWGAIAGLWGKKPVTRQDKINEINQSLSHAKEKIDSNINALPDAVIDSLYEVKRAENQ
ncbi:hypothetical protein DR864_28100 [Runella rosea]|uniref:Uncharacterized protein n=1 Tax=Runella rosea TaxID=2259595 RepID=A0A344TRQ6_9BACT|nr:hypothetical protein [Runella rosea]AXE16260.1 hypothetical protein DR864_00235 [Runella rosea]AXE21327.1 hypothetical protein DR864_28100 [Runella rosea]